MKKTCIIIPIYNSVPNHSEVLSISRNASVLSCFDIFAIHPNGMDLSEYKQFDMIKFLPFPTKYFVSNKTYSKLILSSDFYIPFLKYDYMLIAQTDTLIINTDYSLNDFVEKEYEYWGAPWPNGPFNGQYRIKEKFKTLFVKKPQNLHVGNGGFSLRNIKKCYELTKRHHIYLKYIWCLNEDLFFSQMCTCAPIHEASQFALETNMSEEILKGNVPFAIHAWEKHLNIDISSLVDFDEQLLQNTL